MQRLNVTIIRWSASWRIFLALLVGFQASFLALFIIGDWFATATAGYQPFDLQNPLSLEQVRQQLPSYTARSREIYALFIAADTVFPLLGSLFFSAVLARALRTIDRRWSRAWLAGGVALLPLLSAALDWTENICYAAAIWRYPQDATAWARLGIGLKATKIGFTIICNLGVAALAAYAGRRWLLDRRRGRRPSLDENSDDAP